MYHFSREYYSGDSIFNKFNTWESCKITKNDIYYNKPMFKTHVFKSTSRDIYAVVDGMPFKIPMLNDCYMLRKMLDIPYSEEGVFIIKSYRYHRLNDLNLALSHLKHIGSMIPEDICNDIIKFVQDISKDGTCLEDLDIYTYRLVNFISYGELLKGDRLCKLLNGTITTKLKEEYDYHHRDNTISIELTGKGENKWLVLGDEIIPLQTNPKFKSSKMFIRQSNSVVSEINLDKKDLSFIFDTIEEAQMNTYSYNLKKDKAYLEKQRLELEEKKLISEHIQSEAKHELAMFTNKLDYKTNIIKYMISENNLISSDVSVDKNVMDTIIKVFGVTDTIFKNLTKEKK